MLINKCNQDVPIRNFVKVHPKGHPVTLKYNLYLFWCSPCRQLNKSICFFTYAPNWKINKQCSTHLVLHFRHNGNERNILWAIYSQSQSDNWQVTKKIEKNWTVQAVRKFSVAQSQREICIEVLKLVKVNVCARAQEI